jgi:hypothetical protein
MMGQIRYVTGQFDLASQPHATAQHTQAAAAAAAHTQQQQQLQQQLQQQQRPGATEGGAGVCVDAGGVEDGFLHPPRVSAEHVPLDVGGLLPGEAPAGEAVGAPHAAAAEDEEREGQSDAVRASGDLRSPARRLDFDRPLPVHLWTHGDAVRAAAMMQETQELVFPSHGGVAARREGGGGKAAAAARLAWVEEGVEGVDEGAALAYEDAGPAMAAAGEAGALVGEGGPEDVVMMGGEGEAGEQEGRAGREVDVAKGVASSGGDNCMGGSTAGGSGVHVGIEGGDDVEMVGVSEEDVVAIGDGGEDVVVIGDGGEDVVEGALGGLEGVDEAVDVLAAAVAGTAAAVLPGVTRSVEVKRKLSRVMELLESEQEGEMVGAEEGEAPASGGNAQHAQRAAAGDARVDSLGGSEEGNDENAGSNIAGKWAGGWQHGGWQGEAFPSSELMAPNYASRGHPGFALLLEPSGASPRSDSCFGGVRPVPAGSQEGIKHGSASQALSGLRPAASGGAYSAELHPAM